MRPFRMTVGLRATLLEPTISCYECPPGRRKLAVKVVDISGNDRKAMMEVSV